MNLRRALAVSLLALTSIAHAQSVRPGMRLTVTRVARTGGFTASAFLVVHTTTITRTPAPECGAGAFRIEAEGHDASGRIRIGHLVAVARAEDQAIEVGTGACAARIDLTLDDGAHLVPSRGTLRTRLVGANGLDATLDASVIDTDGVATTVNGHIALSSSP